MVAIRALTGTGLTPARATPAPQCVWRQDTGQRPERQSRVESKGRGDAGGPELRQSPDSCGHRKEARGQSTTGRMVARGALTGTVLDPARATPVS